MSIKKTDNLERIADALDGGGDHGQGTANEVGYLDRIATALEEGGGGGSDESDILIVALSYNFDTDPWTIEMDKTPEEVFAALKDGKRIFFSDIRSNVGMPLTAYVDDTGSAEAFYGYVNFCGINYNGSTPRLQINTYWFDFAIENKITLTSKLYKLEEI